MPKVSMFKCLQNLVLAFVLACCPLWFCPSPAVADGTFDLTLTVAGTGSGEIHSYGIDLEVSTGDNPVSRTFNQDTSVTMIVLPGPTSVFTGWSGDGCSGTDPICTVTMDQDRSITTTFDTANDTHQLTVENINLDYGNDPAVAGEISDETDLIYCGDHCGPTPYTANRVVTLTTSLEQGYALESWFPSDCPGNSFCRVTMDSDKTVTANFNVDADNDGVTDSIEDGGPNGGDANRNNIPDKDENNVATVRDINGHYATIIISGDLRLRNVFYSPPLAETEIDFPFGVFRFRVLDIPQNTTFQATIRIFDTSVVPDTYYAYNLNMSTFTYEPYEFLKGDGEVGAAITPGSEYTDVVLDLRPGSSGEIVMPLADGGRVALVTAGGPAMAPASRGVSGSGCFINALP